MEYEIDLDPDDILNIYRDGRKKGFILGVIFSVTVKYLYDRRKELVPPEVLDDIRRRN